MIGHPGLIRAGRGASGAPVASSPKQSVDRPLQPSRYDREERRQSIRKGRERGCWVYIAAEELVRAGISVFDPPPDYRVWGGRRGGVLVRLYKSQKGKR